MFDFEEDLITLKYLVNEYTDEMYRDVVRKDRLIRLRLTIDEIFENIENSEIPNYEDVANG